MASGLPKECSFFRVFPVMACQTSIFGIDALLLMESTFPLTPEAMRCPSGDHARVITSGDSCVTSVVPLGGVPLAALVGLPSGGNGLLPEEPARIGAPARGAAAIPCCGDGCMGAKNAGLTGVVGAGTALVGGAAAAVWSIIRCRASFTSAMLTGLWAVSIATMCAISAAS